MFSVCTSFFNLFSITCFLELPEAGLKKLSVRCHLTLGLQVESVKIFKILVKVSLVQGPYRYLYILNHGRNNLYP